MIISLLLTGLLYSKGAIITGRVTDASTGNLLIGANVMLENTTYGIATDLDGYYRITDIPIGNYTLITMYIGYETMKKEIIVKSDEKYN